MALKPFALILCLSVAEHHVANTSKPSNKFGRELPTPSTFCNKFTAWLPITSDAFARGLSH
jgi:hypothetical protein